MQPQFTEQMTTPALVAPLTRPPFRILLVDDDFASRLVLQAFLSRYGECHIAANGAEAVAAFRAASDRGEPYNLVCMDVLMPELNGRDAVGQIRAYEEAQGIFSSSGAKIVMITQINCIKEVSRCFKQLCDVYLNKPIDFQVLLNYMRHWRLVD